MADDVISVNSTNAAEFYAAKLNPSNAFPADPVQIESATQETVEPVVKTDPVEPESSLEVETIEPSDPAIDTDEQSKVDPKLQKRFDKLAFQREEAKRDAIVERTKREELEKRLQALESGGKQIEQVAQIDPNAKPLPNQFSDAYQYAEKLAEWSANQAILKRDAEIAQQNANKAWNDRKTATIAELPDYAEVVDNSSIMISDQARDAILDSEIGPKILYHLAQNPEIAEAWKTKSAQSVVKEIGRLEERLSSSKPSPATPVSKISNAPEPISPIRSKSAPSTVLDSTGNVTGSFEDFKKARLAGKIR